jgi:pimeloyl-ACP methyl ester carboxylesterase
MDTHVEGGLDSRIAGPRWLYLHGFASGPGSTKGMALAEHYAGRRVTLECLDLRQPSMEHLRLSSMITHVREAIGAPADRAVVLGSSLGGLTAARVAEEDARVCALVLLAPAFRMAERWRTRLGEEEWERWRSTGYVETEDHARGGMARVDFGFMEDVARVDSPGNGWPDVRVPTLVIHGTRDDVVPVEGSRRWAAGKQHVRLVEVDDGHELVASLDLIAREADRHLAGFLNEPDTEPVQMSK